VPGKTAGDSSGREQLFGLLFRGGTGVAGGTGGGGGAGRINAGYSYRGALPEQFLGLYYTGTPESRMPGEPQSAPKS